MVAERQLRVAHESFYDYIGEERETFLPATGPGPRKRYFDVLYDYLFYVDPDSWRLIPGLAENCQVSEDGLDWTFNLRTDAYWHNRLGVVTAKDVAHTIKSLLEPGAHSSAAPMLQQLVSTVGVMNGTVTVRLTRPYPALPVELSNYGWVPIAPLGTVSTSRWNELEIHPSGSGPYEFQRHSPRESIGFRRAARTHWRVPEPWFGEIRFDAIDDEATRLAGLHSGGYDIVALTQRGAKQLDDRARIVEVRRAANFVLFFGNLGGRLGTSRWSDQRVRAALSLAIDRASLIRDVFAGHAEPVAASHHSPWFDETPHSHRFEPAEARSLLTTAGWNWNDPIVVVRFPMAGGPELPALIDATAEQWRRIGLRVEVRDEPWDAIQTRLRFEDSPLDFVWPQRFPTYYDPEPSMRLFYDGRSSRYRAFSSTKISNLFSKIAHSVTLEEKQEGTGALLRELIMQEAFVALVGTSTLYGVSPKVVDWKPMYGRYPINLEYARKLESVS